MKKIGIVTLCSNENFGNKLQNYALLKTIEKYKLNVNTIWIYNSFKANFIKQFLKAFKKIVIDCTKRRNRIFKKFNVYLKVFRKPVIIDSDFSKISKKFDMIFVGSDQVWNPNYINNHDIYYLKGYFGVKIAYAASFGVDSISENTISQIKPALEKFNHISVREDKGKEIIQNFSNRRDVEVLIDPTMLLSSEEWDIIAKKPNKMKSEDEKYILNYFLGNLSELRKREIEKVAKKNNCKIINILDKEDPFYNCGPSEFLWLEKHAFLICTDSFHSSVFAILYNVPFVVFDRDDKSQSMNSRIDTLLSKFEIDNRRFNGKNITKENLSSNYSKAFKILEKEREKSELFFEKALNLKNGGKQYE